MAEGGARGALGGDSNCVGEQGRLDPVRMVDFTAGVVGVEGHLDPKDELPAAKAAREG
jgi:hypothetical protein